MSGGRRQSSNTDYSDQGEQKRSRSVGKELEVFWPLERVWYKGYVQQMRGARSLVRYEDGDEEWLELDQETVKWADEGGKLKRRKQPAGFAKRNFEYGACSNSNCSSTMLSCFICCRNLPVSVHGPTLFPVPVETEVDAVEEWHHVTDIEHFCSHCFELLKQKRVYRKFGSMRNMDLAAVSECTC
jgi:hypothetical protein